MFEFVVYEDRDHQHGDDREKAVAAAEFHGGHNNRGRPGRNPRSSKCGHHYLNGAGSYWDAGPRKPLVTENRSSESTVGDLKRFKDSVIAAKQFSDDPHSVLDAVIDLIDRTTSQVEKAAEDSEIDDKKLVLNPPVIDDPIDDPRVVSPRRS